MGKMKDILINGDFHIPANFQGGKTIDIMKNLEEMLYGVTKDNIKRDTSVNKFVNRFHKTEDEDKVYALNAISDLLIIMWNIGIFTETHRDWSHPIFLDGYNVSTHIKVTKPKKPNKKREAKHKDVVQPGFRARRGQVTQPASTFHEGLINPSWSKRKRSTRHDGTHDGRFKVRKGR
ncbi:MAG: hypothetical protein HC840_16870 [Leptolyngbyaceae cyanobacterium RM2_2_4]|nr:hypothetical protein [Leptolyngbyaceae cyanobacterium RM2_2_4]